MELCEYIVARHDYDLLRNSCASMGDNIQISSFWDKAGRRQTNKYINKTQEPYKYMMQFNSDGSLRLPGAAGKKAEEEQERMKNNECILIKRTVLRHEAPKTCNINITYSKHVRNILIEQFYKHFKARAQTPLKLSKLSTEEYTLEVGSDFKRCQDCNNFIRHLQDTNPGQVIDKKGNCTFKGHNTMW